MRNVKTGIPRRRTEPLKKKKMERKPPTEMVNIIFIHNYVLQYIYYKCILVILELLLSELKPNVIKDKKLIFYGMKLQEW